MPSVEITAKSASDALVAAADKLGVPPESVKITVLEEVKGLFGKSSVRVLAETIDAPAPVASKAKAPKAEKPAPAPAAAPAPVAEVAPVAAPEPVKEKPARRSKKVEAPAPVAAETSEEAPAAVVAETESAATQADADQLIELVKELIAAAGLEVEVKFGGINGRYVTIGFDGTDSSYLVGKHGEVINAFQYLVNVIGGRRFDNGVRANLDANDYRRRREDALTAHAVKIADQVKERGEEALLPTMPAFERRIIHKAIQSVSGVSTYSEGEEPNRRVVIAPAN